MYGDLRRIHVYQVLRTMNLDFEIDDCGFIHVDEAQWQIFLPIDDGDLILITFHNEVDPSYAGDLAIRFSWFLQIVGFRVVAVPGFLNDEPNKTVGFIR
jgi:hypothetical protein